MNNTLLIPKIKNAENRVGTSYILSFGSISSKDVLQVGGKNASLEEMISHLRAKGISVPDGFATTADLQQVGKLAIQSKVANAVVWLCSDAASFVTGHVMPVDGGWVAQ